MSRAVLKLLAAGLSALAFAAAPASAGIWTEIPSGTTEEITAIEYRGGEQFWYATGSGKIFKRVGGTFQMRHSAPGVVFRDIEFNADGSIGVAVGSNGHAARSIDGGATWSVLAVPPSQSATSETDCATTAPAGDLDSVRADGLGRVWVAGSGAQIWRSTGPAFGQGLEDANGGAAATCTLVNRDIDAMVFVPGAAAGYFIAKSFGQVFFSSDPFTTSAAQKPGDAGNGFQFLRRAVGDPANTNRMWSVVPGNGGTSYVKRTIDGWSSTSDWVLANADRRGFSNAYDIDYAGGTVLAAGAAGMVLNSVDGERFYFNDADGVLATQDWRAVSLADGGNGAIGGTNGKLALTSTANALPTVSTPPPAPPGTPPTTPPKSGRKALPVSFTGRGNALSAKIVGRRVRVRMRGTIRPPAGARVRAACKGKVRLVIKKKRKTLKQTSARLKVKRGRCRFGKTVFIKRRKVGRKTTRLRLKVSFAGNAVLQAGSATKTLVIKR